MIGARITSFVFVVVFVTGILFMFLMVIWVRKWIRESLVNILILLPTTMDGMFTLIAFFLITTCLYFALAMLYYFGPSKRKTFRFFSAGATLATILIVLISEGYTLYITNFAKYNELYGSLGTILALMLWIYLISFALLIGFELNASIHGAIHNRKLDNFKDIEDRYDNNY